MVVDNVAVVIPRPTINPDEYQPFDYDLYRKTVEDVLSDEPRLASSFDEYSNGHANDTGSEYQRERAPVRGKRLESEKQRDATARAQAQAQARARLSGKKKSPYFSTGRVKKAAVAQRRITRIESESESESEAVAEVVATPADEEDRAMSLEAAMPLYDGGDEAEAEVDNERENVTGEPEDEDALGKFLLSHPFMKEGGYPVGRRARQQFVVQLRSEAGALGMDTAAVDELVKNVKTAYLETWALGHTIQNDNPDGSEFGDEFDDKERKSKKRKRNRHDSEGSMKQSRDKDRTSGSEEGDFLPVRLKPGPVDTDQAMDTLLQSLPELPSRPVLTNEANLSVKPDTTRPSGNTPENTESFGSSDLELDHSPEITDTQQNIVIKPVPAQRTHGKGSAQVDSGIHAHPVSLDHNDTTSKAKGIKRNVTAGSASKKQVATNNVGKLELDKGKQETEPKQSPAKRTERRRRRRQRLKEKKRERRESAINRNSTSAPVSGKQPENLHQDFY